MSSAVFAQEQWTLMFAVVMTTLESAHKNGPTYKLVRSPLGGVEVGQ
jgi:hypothetical protein